MPDALCPVLLAALPRYNAPHGQGRLILQSTRVLVFAGSIRTGALSAKLAAIAARELAVQDAEVTLISLADYPLPLYNGDDEARSGIPDNALKLARLIEAQQGVFISTPEYNHSLPPLLKNAIDWVSRIKPGKGPDYRYRLFALGGTSDGFIGGARAVVDLRKVLAYGLKAIIMPDQITVSKAKVAFDEAGNFTDPAPAAQLKLVCEKLIETIRRMRG
ncbi:MAG: NAD(P)H-dependent oxidoreductase [Bauldia sp.]|nr:NAD(P)H-dependent oxidoreductase [Bauldia sp.]